MARQCLARQEVCNPLSLFRSMSNIRKRLIIMTNLAIKT